MDQAGSVQFFSLPDIFPVGSEVFLLAHPYYGSKGRVINHPEDRVRIEVTQLTEPDLMPAVQYNDVSFVIQIIHILCILFICKLQLHVFDLIFTIFIFSKFS